MTKGEWDALRKSEWEVAFAAAVELEQRDGAIAVRIEGREPIECDLGSPHIARAVTELLQVVIEQLGHAVVVLGLVVALLAGCGYAPGGAADAPPPADATPDAPAAADASPDAARAVDAAPDAAAGGLPLDAVCVPTSAQCDPTPMQPLWPFGLTCRIRGSSDGRCRPIGLSPEGGRCGNEDDCGANMTCLSAPDGMLRCFVVCDTLQPLVRCAPSQTCTPLVGPTGVCTP